MIDGLTYISGFISDKQEKELISVIDSFSWENIIKSRRVQQYGFRYDYLKKTASLTDGYIGEIPDWLKTYGKMLVTRKYFEKEPDQVIINEYLPGQGISRHVDKFCFDKTVASLSLGSTCSMELEHVETHKVGSTILEPRSLLVLSGEARYNWMHSIPFRTQDWSDGIYYPRGRRISLTFRNMVL